MWGDRKMALEEVDPTRSRSSVVVHRDDDFFFFKKKKKRHIKRQNK